MAHSLLSARRISACWTRSSWRRAAEQAYHDGAAPLAAVEGFVRQVIGWRDYIWHLYWYLGEGYRSHNELDQRRSIQDWFAALDPDGTGRGVRPVGTGVGRGRRAGCTTFPG